MGEVALPQNRSDMFNSLGEVKSRFPTGTINFLVFELKWRRTKMEYGLLEIKYQKKTDPPRTVNSAVRTGG